MGFGRCIQFVKSYGVDLSKLLNDKKKPIDSTARISETNGHKKRRRAAFSLFQIEKFSIQNDVFTTQGVDINTGAHRFTTLV